VEDLREADFELIDREPMIVAGTTVGCWQRPRESMRPPVAGRDRPWGGSLCGAWPGGPFRDRGITEPASHLEPVPPRGTRRAGFPHRAPQVALAGPVRQWHDEAPRTAARTMCGSGDSTSTADVAGCGGAALESTAAGLHAERRQVVAGSGVIRSTDRSPAASSSGDAAGLAASSADVPRATLWCAPETSDSSSRSGGGPPRTCHGGSPFHIRA